MFSAFFFGRSPFFCACYVKRKGVKRHCTTSRLRIGEQSLRLAALRQSTSLYTREAKSGVKCDFAELHRIRKNLREQILASSRKRTMFAETNYVCGNELCLRKRTMFAEANYVCGSELCSRRGRVDTPNFTAYARICVSKFLPVQSVARSICRTSPHTQEFA